MQCLSSFGIVLQGKESTFREMSMYGIYKSFIISDIIRKHKWYFECSFILIFFLLIFYRYMDPGDPSKMDQADAKINAHKEVALEAKIKKELDDLIDDFDDEDDEEDDIFKGEDFESSDDFEDDSDSDYKSSLRSGARYDFT